MHAHTDCENTADKLQLSLADAVDAALERLRPLVRADGGDLELIAIDGDVIRVAMQGSCRHCGMAAHTLGHLRREIVALCNIPVRVLPAL